MDRQIDSQKNNPECISLIRNYPFFALLLPKEVEELASLMQKITAQPHETIVLENEVVDWIYLIADGTAEITRTHKTLKTANKLQLGTISKGNCIGLTEYDFFSLTGLRSATVTALTPMVLYGIPVSKLFNFLRNRPYQALNANAEKILLMNFIRNSILFNNLPTEKIKLLVMNTSKISVPANTVIFKQNDDADSCYFILTGQVMITRTTADQVEKTIANLEQGDMFGENAFIPGGKRNASAHTRTDSEFFILNKRVYSEVTKKKSDISSSVEKLKLLRSHPFPKSSVIVTENKTEKETNAILSDGKDIKLSLNKNEWELWKKFDGKRKVSKILEEILLDPNFTRSTALIFISELIKLGLLQLPLDELINE